MNFPNLNSNAKEQLIEKFEKIIQNIKKAKSLEEKKRLMAEGIKLQFNIEEQILNTKKIKDYPEYQKCKELIYDFFNWVENRIRINIFEATYEDKFFNEVHIERTLTIASLLQILNFLPIELQAYFVLNIFRTTYELNFKNMTLILHKCRKRGSNSGKRFYSLDDFKSEFKDYPKYFVLEIRKK